MSLRVQLINRTKYNTRDIAKLFRAAIKAEGAGANWPSLPYILHVRTARSKCITGYGYYHRPWVQINLPAWDGSERLLQSHVEVAAQILIHEIGHNLGLRHREMVDFEDIDVSWSYGMQIRVRA